MTNIIKITKNEIGNAELNSVNARDIHNYLQVNSKFADWIKRAIVKYDFKENIDFTVLKNENAEKWEFSPTEYIVTMDMAKELAMLENNPKGRETRKYFINCEKELQKSSPYAALQEIATFQKKTTRATARHGRYFNKSASSNKQFGKYCCEFIKTKLL